MKRTERILRFVFGEFPEQEPASWQMRLITQEHGCQMYIPVRRNKAGQLIAAGIFLYVVFSVGEDGSVGEEFWLLWNLLCIPFLWFMYRINRPRWEWKLFDCQADAESYKSQHIAKHQPWKLQ